MLKNEIVNNLRLSKTYINNILYEIDRYILDGFDKQDIELSEKLYKVVLELSNKLKK